LKFGIFVHSKRPKISPNEILKVVESAGVSYSNRDPDMAIVVGGMALLAITEKNFIFLCSL